VRVLAFPLGMPVGGVVWIAAIGFIAGALALTVAAPPAPRLVWNASASAPVGLYWVRPRARLARGVMAVARTPEPWRRLAAERRYLPANVPLVKRVAGVPGDRICAQGERVSINGKAVATRLRQDAEGRPMPRWEGCRILSTREVFLLMTGVRGSFDGRYFGPTDKADVIGRARLLWAL